MANSDDGTLSDEDERSDEYEKSDGDEEINEKVPKDPFETIRNWETKEIAITEAVPAVLPLPEEAPSIPIDKDIQDLDWGLSKTSMSKKAKKKGKRASVVYEE